MCVFVCVCVCVCEICFGQLIDVVHSSIYTLWTTVDLPQVRGFYRDASQGSFIILIILPIIIRTSEDFVI